jgi:hypothetical protein
MHFTSFSKWGILLKMQFCVEAPGKIWGQAIGSLDPQGGGLVGIRRLRRHSLPEKGSGSTTCSPRVGWRPWFGQRSRRRGRSAMAGGGGRGGSGSGEGSAHGWKCEACWGATGPRECVGLADRLWGREATRAHGGGDNYGRRVGGAC